MKKIILILGILVVFTTKNIFPQNNLAKSGAIETVSAGAIDFLLSNPKTASKFNATEETALSTLANVLQIFGERKHEINLATAGKDQIIINSNDGRQVTAVMDNQGNMYFQKDGVIYPIASSLVNQAKDYVLNQQSGYMDYVKENSYVKDNSSNTRLMLPNYNYSQLEKIWDEAATPEFRYIVLNEDKYMKDIINELDLNLEDLYYTHKKEFLPVKESESGFIQKFLNNENKVKMFDNNYAWLGCTVCGLMPTSYLYLHSIKYHLRGTFTSRWVRDINGDGKFMFDEFQDIRRNFFQNESFVIATGLYAYKKYYIKLSVYDQLTGNLVHTDEIGNANERIDMGYFTFSDNYFNPGIYIYNISFIGLKNNLELGKLSERFQILSVDQIKEKEKETNIQSNTPKNESSSREKMMNELIQLLKEGKISEETFKSSMKALEKN
jgi:hypothetical protein